MTAEEYKKILEALINLVDMGIYVVDTDGVGMFYNQIMADMEQIRIDDVIGKPFAKAFPGVKLEESTMYQALKKNVEIRNKQQSYTSLYGKEIATINSTVPVIHEGKTIAAIEVARDVTNIRSMSDTILQLREKEIKPKEARPKLKKYTFDDLIGNSPLFTAVLERAKRAAGNDASVFIYGETGTGKELLAQSIHYASARRQNPFLAQNCAALPESLLEGILFGTTKGGFSGEM